jgi:hypothetical protein
MKKVLCSIDIVDIKQKIASGRFAVKMNMLGGILLEDTQTCEAVKIMQLPDTYSFHKQGKWNPVWEYTSTSIDHPMEGREAWSCSECGWTTDEKHDYCVCGADMRESNRANKVSEQFKKLVDKL